MARTSAVGRAPIRPGIPADFIGVQWRGPLRGGAIRLWRKRRWTQWRPLHRGELSPSGRFASELVAARDATAYQLRLPSGVRSARAVAINTTDGPGRKLGARARARPGVMGRAARSLCYRSRAAWGADESLRLDTYGQPRSQPEFFPLQRLTVHHTAIEGGGVDAAALVRAIYRYHVVDLGFADIGYHLLIDERGCVYEGRHSGDDRLPVFAASSPGEQPKAVNGAHVAQFNAGNVGVALLGDFTARAPTPRARRALIRSLAALTWVTDLDPLGGGRYTNPISGRTKDIPVISGHRDWLATECPGAKLYRQLSAIRRRVARLRGRLP